MRPSAYHPHTYRPCACGWPLRWDQYGVCGGCREREGGAMNLREAVDVVGIEADPLGCGFAIAAFIRTAVQREPSTYEGECATLRAAIDTLPYDVTTPAGIRAWLDDLGTVAELDMPRTWWLNLLTADG